MGLLALQGQLCGIEIFVAVLRGYLHSGDRLNAVAYHLIDGGAERLTEIYLGMLVVADGSPDNLGSGGVDAVELTIGVYWQNLLFKTHGLANLFADPVVGVDAAVDGVFRQHYHEYRCRGNSLLDLLIEEAVFQLIVVEKHSETALGEHELQNAGILCSAVAAVADEYVVVFF